MSLVKEIYSMRIQINSFYISFFAFLGNNPPGFSYKSETHCWVCSGSTPIH
nr:MAG TPA: hypothetical protein [Herelleviridae sp.]